MIPNSRPLLARLSNRTKVIGAAIVVLAVTATASAGFIHLPRLSSGGSPMVATMKPLSADTIAPLEALNRATVAVAARVLPTVVQIQVSGKAPARSIEMPQNIPAPFRQFFQGPFQQPHAQPFHALGSGVIVSPNGYIITNNHVVDGATQVQVMLNNGRTYPAKVVGTDKDTDLAVVKIDAPGLISAQFGDSNQLAPGQTVLAIGTPLGEASSITRGIISALNRPRNGSQDTRGNFIQTDAPINHGNSGGPLVNIRGQVIGINTEMLTDSGGSIGIGLAIPSDLVKSVATDLIEHGKVIRGYLGITVSQLQPGVATSLHEPDAQGALVDQVNAGSPADQAGIKPYDVVTDFNGTKITTSGQLTSIAGSAAPGTKATVNILRNGKPMQFTLTMGNFANAPTADETASAGSSDNGTTPKLGLTVTPLTPDIRDQLHLPAGVNGLAVQSVEPDGPAAMRLTRGDIIEQVNQKPVTSIAALEAQLKATPAGGDVLLMVYRQGSNLIVPITPQP
ncbi:MAG: Do family serine endopeptidase [Acidobacteria bacterium]|nr:MAG: Do family serine endopeptidase [Acidobacteriota bacterium]